MIGALSRQIFNFISFKPTSDDDTLRSLVWMFGENSCQQHIDDTGGYRVI